MPKKRAKKSPTKKPSAKVKAARRTYAAAKQAYQKAGSALGRLTGKKSRK